MMTTRILVTANILLIALLIPCLAWGGTCGATGEGHCDGAPWVSDSASHEDVNYCVNTCASSGDTVTVANGNATWDTQVVFTKGVKLVGGTGTITVSGGDIANFVIKWAPATPASNEAFEMTGFTLSGGYILHLYNSSDSVVLSKVNIHHNTFTQTADAYVFQTSGGPIYGVIHNNTFTSTADSGDYAGADAYGHEVFNLLGQDSNWNNFIHEYGTGNALYIENNTFAGGSVARPIDSGRGHKMYVARYNTITWNDVDTASSGFDIHGDQEAGCGTMSAEIYGNLITTHGRADELNDQRGGWALVFYNSKQGTYGISHKLYNDDGNESGTCVHAANSVSNDISNSYYWANWNTNGDASTITTQAGVPTADEDYWAYAAAFDGTSGVGCGTIGDRPATCTTGVGYWATAQSCSDLTGMVGANPTTPISGTLYKCTSTNTWTAYYTPYTYPHPLRGLASTSPIGGVTMQGVVYK